MDITGSNNIRISGNNYAGPLKKGREKTTHTIRDGFSRSEQPMKELDLGKQAHALKAGTGKKPGLLGNILKGAGVGALLGGVAAIPFILAGPFTMLAAGAVGAGALLGGALSAIEGKGGGGSSDDTAVTNMQTTLRTLNIPNMSGFSGPGMTNFH